MRRVPAAFLLSAPVLSALVLISGAASAAVFDLSYITADGDSAVLTLTTEDTLTTSSFGSGFLITGVSGERDNVAVVGKSSAYQADNLLLPSAPFFDIGGFSYETLGGDLFGVYSPNLNPQTLYGECFAFPCNSQNLGTTRNITSLSLSAATPIPATLPLFATGLAGLGWLARRRRKQVA